MIGPLPKTRSGLVHYDSPLLAVIPDLLYAVTTRIGGVSTGPRRWLNLSDSVPADPGAALANRDRVSSTLGIPAGRTVFADQVHGTEIRTVTLADGGIGYFPPDSGVAATDGLVTAAPGLFLVILSADCPSVAVVDPVQRVLGLAHSGRKGTLASIAGKTVAALVSEHGSRPNDLVAAIGPSIHACCYEVGPDVALEVRRVLPAASAFLPVKEARTHFDLQAAIRSQLLEAGLAAERIESSPLCTACRTDHFYSYRAEGARTGRFATLLGWRE